MTHQIVLPLIYCFAVMFLFMTALYLHQRRSGNAGIVDVGWSAGMGLAALLYAILLDGYAPRVWLVTALVMAWSFRLAGYILFNRVLGREEDGRYTRLREYWGNAAPRNFFFFFQAQALLVVVFSIPYLMVMLNPAPTLGLWDVLGVAIWLIAVAGESIADRQLARFRSDPANKGRTCRAGLWNYSRHPNYFFEWVHWWTYVVMSIGAPGHLLTWLGPILMFLFLFKVTGIPYTEKQALASRGDDYRDYQRTTSAFFPWFKKG